jgi:hypothetical protein
LLKFVNTLYKDYKRKQILEEKRYLISNDNKYVLFSGTLLKQNGDIRHINDLYFIIYLLHVNKISNNNITLAVDKNILSELKDSPLYKDIYSLIIKFVGEVIDVLEFESLYKRNENKDLIFIASGHGDINGLAIGQNQRISSDYFESIASYRKGTLLIMSQCFAGAFHHLDTRKNICVLGASEYQTSLSIQIKDLLNSNQIKELEDKHLEDFILNGLAFRTDIPINPFIFSFFITIFKPEIIKSSNKHLINIYKSTASQTLNYLNTFQQIFRIEQVFDVESESGKQQILFDSNKSITQQPYLLNKIMAARFVISNNS